MLRITGREHRRQRSVFWLYAGLLLLVAYGYARYDVYVMDGDGTSFLDIAEALRTHRAFMAVNAYWNPAYPAFLSVAERITHPGLWRELAMVRYTNVLIFAMAAASTIFFTRALAQARATYGLAENAVLSGPALDLLGLGLLTMSLGRELPVAAPRADTLLFLWLMLAAGLLLRLLQEQRPLWLFPALGGALGLAYLTKSFAFLPSLALLAGLAAVALFRQGRGRVGTLVGVAVSGVLFLALAGPYILAISRQLGHFSTGESARLNYAFFIDMTPRWHEWFHGDLGHAHGAFVHAEAVLVRRPPVFSYAGHPEGTYPLWFDPAYWTLGIKPHVWLKGHVLRLLRNVALFLRYLLGRPEIFVLFGVLVTADATLRSTASPLASGSRWRQRVWYLAPLAWGALMLAIYFPVDLQDRYLTAPLFLVVLPLFAALQVRPGESREGMPTQRIAGALVLLFAFLLLSQAVTYLAERRRHIPPAEQRHPGYDPQIFTAAAALRQLGVRPGDKIACMGDLACYTDHYWARLAGAQILGEIETPNEANPVAVWNAIPEKSEVTAPLAAMGLRYIVSLFPNSTTKPAGWVQLGGSNFFAYPLTPGRAVHEASDLASFQATP